MTSKICIKWFCLLCIVAPLILSCPKPQGPANVILISIDTLRADHVSIYGYPQNTTPHIDQVARKGIRFVHAFTTAPWTLPAHISLFTGLPPSLHQVERQDTKLSQKIQTLPELFRANGYSTAGLVTLPFVTSKYGFARGFQYFKQLLNARAKIVTNHALSWIAKQKQNPFFLFLHFCDVHWPYKPSGKYAVQFGVDIGKKNWHRVGKYRFLRKFINPRVKMSKKVRAHIIGLYDGEIRNVDDQIGRLLTFLQESGINKNTILIITSDHGEEFKEHHSFGHGHQFYAEVVHIPMIIHFPAKIGKGITVANPVSLLDLPLTLLKLCRLKAPEQFQKFAVDLRQYFNKKPPKNNSLRSLIIENMRSGPKSFSLIRQNHKYMTSSQYSVNPSKRWVVLPESLFNITEDPTDSHNLLQTKPIHPLSKKIRFENRQHLHRYINQNVCGTQLQFRLYGTPLQQPLLVKGTINVAHQWHGFPFGTNLGSKDYIHSNHALNTCQFAISLDSPEKKIYFLLSENSEKITIHLQQNDKVLYHSSIPPPPSNEILPLIRNQENKFSIMIKGSLLKSDTIKFRLTNKDKKELETLGYID